MGPQTPHTPQASQAPLASQSPPPWDIPPNIAMVLRAVLMAAFGFASVCVIVLKLEAAIGQASQTARSRKRPFEKLERKPRLRARAQRKESRRKNLPSTHRPDWHLKKDIRNLNKVDRIVHECASRLARWLGICLFREFLLKRLNEPLNQKQFPFCAFHITNLSLIGKFPKTNES